MKGTQTWSVTSTFEAQLLGTERDNPRKQRATRQLHICLPSFTWSTESSFRKCSEREKTHVDFSGGRTLVLLFFSH